MSTTWNLSKDPQKNSKELIYLHITETSSRYNLEIDHTTLNEDGEEEISEYFVLLRDLKLHHLHILKRIILNARYREFTLEDVNPYKGLENNMDVVAWTIMRQYDELRIILMLHGGTYRKYVVDMIAENEIIRILDHLITDHFEG